jgi:hypothetical protein
MTERDKHHWILSREERDAATKPRSERHLCQREQMAQAIDPRANPTQQAQKTAVRERTGVVASACEAGSEAYSSIKLCTTVGSTGMPGPVVVGLRVRHQATLAQHAGDLCHLVGGGDGGVEVQPAALDAFDQVVTADHVRAGRGGGFGLVPHREHHDAGSLAGVVRQVDGAAHHLVSLTRVDAEPVVTAEVNPSPCQSIFFVMRPKALAVCTTSRGAPRARESSCH